MNCRHNNIPRRTENIIYRSILNFPISLSRGSRDQRSPKGNLSNWSNLNSSLYIYIFGNRNLKFVPSTFFRTWVEIISYAERKATAFLLQS